MQVQIEEGTVNPQSTIQEYLPECDWDSSSSSEVGTITLDELRLQTSGLPAQPPNRADTGTPDGNPFGGYTNEMLCSSLTKLTGLPTRGRFSYSNYAFGILGFLLTRAEQQANPDLYPNEPPSYEELVKLKVLDPMGMDDTVVDFDLETAAVGCSRGLKRGQPTIRIGKYGVLQGNGALRSTLPDMGLFIEALMHADQRIQEQRASSSNTTTNALRGSTPEITNLPNIDLFPFLNDPTTSPLLAALVTAADTGNVDLACTCVSGWCEGWLCPLPNAINEETTIMGTTTFTSANKLGHRKSGDTGGYSLRGVWSYEKRRGVFAVDTCGGCGQRGTSGSAVQRLALLLADGPPTNSIGNHHDIITASRSGDEGAEEKEDNSSLLLSRRFVGEASSHAFPSNTKLQVEVREPRVIDGSAATVSVASSDGQGCTSSATPLGDNAYELHDSAFLGCGWSSGEDPLVDDVPQSRKLIITPLGTIFQEMGVDIYLLPEDGTNSDSGEQQQQQQQQSSDDGEDKSSSSSSSSAYNSRSLFAMRHGGGIMMLLSLFYSILLVW